MNKLIEITVAGILFKVEDAAWEALRSYKESLKNHFSNQMGSKDIIEDIESRMAELMSQKSEGKGYVSEADVLEIIAMLGKPYEMDGGEQESQTNYNYNEAPYTEYKKRLFRDGEKRVLGGVCAGLGEYFDLDAVWIRLAFAISFFFLGTGFLLYIILWAVIPEAKTVADRLQMKGEKVTAESIGKFFTTESDNVKKKFNEYDKSEEVKKWKNHSKNASSQIASAAKQVFKYFGKFIALIFVAISFIFLITFILAYFGLFNRYAVLPASGIPFLSTLYETDWEGNLVIIGFTLLVSIPLIMIISKGISLISERNKLPRFYSSLMGMLWGLAWLVLIAMSFRTAQLFSVTATSKDVINIPSQDTLIITGFSKSNKNINYKFNFSGFSMKGKYINRFTPNINILKTNQPNIFIEMEKEASGSDQKNALSYAEQIPNGFINDKQYIHLSPIFSFDKKDTKWRNQQLDLDIYIPVGTIILLENTVFDNIDHIESNFDNVDLKGSVLKMTATGLEPIQSK